MATEHELEQWRADLQASFPIFGKRKRQKAILAMAERREEPEVVPLLVDTLTHSDPETASQAKAALESLATRPARDALCALAIKHPDSPAAKIAVAGGYRHSDHEQDCLFLFITRQLDLYFQPNEYGQDEFQTLRMVYDRAEPATRERVMEIVRSGDIRCQPFAVRPRRSQALSECTDAEIKLAIQSCLRHKDWPRLLVLCLELPMKFAFPLLDYFRESGWEPDKPELKSLYHQILAESAGQSYEAPKESSPTSSVFERWLAEGRQGELAQTTESELVGRLVQAIPPDGVKIVAALAAKPRLAPATIEAVAKSEHWLVRLAGLATGITKDIVKDIGQDPNYWVNELAGAAGVLEFWPGKATPADLEKLRAAPAEAFAGKLGAVRKVLRSILAYRVTDVEIGEVTVVLDGEAAEIILAD